MRYIRAFYSVEPTEDVELGMLPALHAAFDDRVFALPYHRGGWGDDYRENFAAVLIIKEGGIDAAGVQGYLEKSLAQWGIEDAHLTKMDDCTLEDCFMDSMRLRFRCGAFDEDQIKRLLNLSATCTFIGANRYGMRDSVVEWSLPKEKALELAEATGYKANLQAELEAVFAPAQLEGADGIAAPHVPVTYLVESDVLTDADEAINILVGALREAGRIQTGHVFTINLDEYTRWPVRDQDNDYRMFLNPQLIRVIEGNTLVVRYGTLDSPGHYDVQAYKLLVRLIDLLRDAAPGTQVMLSVPEGNADLVMRLRRRLGTPVIALVKDCGTAASRGSFEQNLEAVRAMAADRGIEPDETLSKLLLKRMRGHAAIELESVFAEWLTYQQARQAFPQYASAIDDAIELDAVDENASAQERLEDLIGLDGVKEHIRNIILRVQMNQQLLEKGLPLQPFSMHMAFLGAPGTGKTEVARLYAEILKEHGILSEGRLVTVSGGSGFNVEKAFEAAKGSVLLIDEAYGMLGFENTIAELIAQMENNRADTVVILAGYEGHMNALFDSNPGFRSRIGFTIKFPDYTADEFERIFAFMCEQRKVVMAEGAQEVVRDMVERGGKRADQGNARFIRKLFEDAVGAQQVRLAKRCKEDGAELALDDLRTLTVADIEKAAAIGGIGRRKRTRSAREELDALIGLDGIKKLVAARMDFAKMQKVKRDAGLKAPFIPMHMAFKGNPGTGKTEVARLVARILREEGVLSVGDVYECGRQDLVSPIAGATAPMVEALFQKARGSVIFIDEAYALIDGAKGGPGDEAINALIDQMEKLRDEVVVILAGYTKEIDDLLTLNPGFQSRIKAQLEFPDYSADELLAILHHMAEKQGCALGDGVDEKVCGFVEKGMRDTTFGNARFVRNLLEDALVNQSVRLAETMVTEASKGAGADAANTLKDDRDGVADDARVDAADGKQPETPSVEELSLLLAEDFTWEGEAAASNRIVGFAA